MQEHALNNCTACNMQVKNDGMTRVQSTPPAKARRLVLSTAELARSAGFCTQRALGRLQLRQKGRGVKRRRAKESLWQPAPVEQVLTAAHPSRSNEVHYFGMHSESAYFQRQNVYWETLSKACARSALGLAGAVRAHDAHLLVKDAESERPAEACRGA